MDDRIKLAEAMRWHSINDKYIDRDTNLYVLAGFPPDVRPYGVRSILPDPFTDANDDYAVLEWVRKQVVDHSGSLPSGKPKWSASDSWWLFWDSLQVGSKTDYKIGDYAWAALKVLNTDASFQDGFMTKEQAE